MVRVFSAFALLGLLTFVQAPLNTAQIVLVVNAPTRDGFVDTSSEIEDSVKDIRTRVGDVRELGLTTDPTKADIVLTVVARGTGVVAWGARTGISTFYNSAVLTTLPVAVTTRWVSAVLQVGSYKKEFSAGDTKATRSSMGAWGSDADQIVKDVRAWVRANDAMIRSKRR